MNNNLIRIIITASFLLSACVEDTVEDTYPNTEQVNYTNISDSINPSDPYDYLNSLRQLSGLVTLFTNIPLANSAYNHADYLTTHKVFGHDEDTNLEGFTGVHADDRAILTGYYSRDVGEGISTGRNSLDSIDNLMSAIYHRFTLFSLDKDEIGMGFVENTDTSGGILVHNIGNSNLDTLCKGSSYSSSGLVYFNVCADNSLKILSSTYNDANHTILQQNPEFVVWPAINATDIPPAFFEETPDPLPNQSVSGYPISVQFNPATTQTVSNVNMALFNVTKQTDITDVLWMQQGDGSDPAMSFTSMEFALFPLQRLDWNNVYQVTMNYTLNGVSESTQWQFTTRALSTEPIVITDASQLIELNNNKTNYLYFVPANGNDVINLFTMRHPSNVQIQGDYVDSNTLQLHISGSIGDQMTLTINNVDYTLRISG